MNNVPLASIGCIAFNHEKYIRTAIEGFLIQKTTFPIEIIIHDDASTDRTPRIITEYAEQYPNVIRTIFQRENQYSKKKKPFVDFVLPQCRGRYIAICEGDDFWTDPTKLQRQVDFLESNPGYVVCYHNSIVVDENGNLISKSKLKNECKRDYSSQELISAVKLLPNTMCFRNVITEFPDEFYRAFGGDKFLTSLLGVFGKGKYIGDIKPSAFRIHSGGINSGESDVNKKLKNHLSTRTALYQYYERIGKTEYCHYFLTKGINETIVNKIEFENNAPTTTKYRSAGDTSKEIVERYYTGKDANQYENRRKNNPKWKFEEDVLRGVLEDLRKEISVIMDVPVGTGRFLPLYTSLGDSVNIYGIDYSADMIKIASNASPSKNLSFIKQDVLNTALDISSDLTVCYRFLNLIDWDKAASALRNILGASRKYTVFTIRTIDRNYTGPILIENKIHLHQEADVLKLIDDCDFEIFKKFDYKDDNPGSYSVLLCKKKRRPFISSRVNINSKVIYTYGDTTPKGKIYQVKDNDHARFIESLSMHPTLSDYFPKINSISGKFVDAEWVAGEPVKETDWVAIFSILSKIQSVQSNLPSSFDYVEDLVIPRFSLSHPITGAGFCDRIVGIIRKGATNYPMKVSHPDMIPGNVLKTADGYKVIDNELMCYSRYHRLDVLNACFNFGVEAGNAALRSFDLSETEWEFLQALWVARQIGSFIVKEKINAAVQIYHAYQRGDNILPFDFKARRKVQAENTMISAGIHLANDKMTVIVRSSGERTTEACVHLIEQAVDPRNIVIVRESPFTQAIRKSFEIGIERGKDWLLVIDADVLAKPSSILDMLTFAETLHENAFVVQGLVLDKVFGVRRPAGNHLYRTCHLQCALHCIPEEGNSLRPESTMIEGMVEKGYLFYQKEFLIGLHDFEQDHFSIFKKSFLHARKHHYLIMDMLPYWQELAKSDLDYLAMVKGVGGATKYDGKIFIDADFLSRICSSFFDKKLFPEKSPLTLGQYDEKRIDRIVFETLKSSHCQRMQEKVFPKNRRDCVFGPLPSPVNPQDPARLKLTFVANNPDQLNGPNIWLQRILPELIKRKFCLQAIFIVPSPGPSPAADKLRQHGVDCLFLKRKPYTEETVSDLLKILHSDPPDVFIPNLCVPAYYAARWVKAAGIPTVGIIRSDDTFHHELVEYFVAGDPAYRLSGVVCKSKFLEQYVLSHSAQGVSTLCSASGSWLPPKVAGQPEETLNLVFTGRLVQRQKRIFDVIDALKRVVTEIPGCRASIYGEDREGGKVLDMINTLNLGEKLAYGGMIPFENIYPTLLAHHVFVLLSDYEGMSTSLMEAMACGLVPICTKTRSGALEIIRHNENGLLVDDRKETFMHAVARLKNEKGLWERLSKAARTTIEKEYNINLCADKWAKFVINLAKEKNIRKIIEIPNADEINLPPAKVSDNGICREDIRRPRPQQNVLNKADYFLNPPLTHENMDLYVVRSGILRALMQFLPHCKGVLLDVGCGEMPYKPLIIPHVKKYIGLDIKNAAYQRRSQPDLLWDGTLIPLKDASVDCAIATELFEHLPHPELILHEIHRVLRTDGIIFFTVPFLWPLHEVPHDEYRYTPFSIQRLFANAGFNPIAIKALGGWDAALAQMIGLWVRRKEMKKEERVQFARNLFPFYRKLIEADQPPIEFKEGQMVTGLCGTATKSVGAGQFHHPKSLSPSDPVVIIEDTFPTISETFILDQITGLTDLGVKIENWSLHRSSQPVIHPKVLNYGLIAKTKYLSLPRAIGQFSADRWVEQFAAHNDLPKLTQIKTIHVHFGPTFMFLEPLFRCLKSYVIVSFHGYDASQVFKEKGDDCYRYLFERADGITTPSSYMKNELVKRGCNPDKISIHHYGIELSKFKPTDSRRNQVSVRLLTVARLVEKKGIEFALKAFAKLPNRKDVEYRIIGDGPLKQVLQQLTRELGIEKEVQFQGAKSHEAIIAEMADADIFVLTSVTAANGDSEGVPVSLIEAQAMELPVVSSNHAGIPELVTHAESGFLANERDVEQIAGYLHRLIGDKALRELFGKQGRKKVIQEFDIEKLNKQLAGFLINRPKPQAGISNAPVPHEKRYPCSNQPLDSNADQPCSGQIRISICIPAYNREHFIAKAITSALAQSCDRYEIVIVDDGSTDKTAEVVRSFSSDKIRLFEKKHTGTADTRNRAIREARGEFILWLDSDDQLIDNILQEYEHYLQRYGDFDVLYCNNIRYYVREKREQNIRYHSFNGKIPAARFFGGPPIPNGGSLIRKSLFEKVGYYDINFLRAHDYEFWVRAVRVARFRHCPKVLYRHVLHGQQQLSPVDYANTDTAYEVRITENIINGYRLEELHTDVAWSTLSQQARAKAIADIYLKYAKLFMRWGGMAQARQYIVKSIELDPLPEKQALLKQVDNLHFKSGVQPLSQHHPDKRNLPIVAIIAAYNEGDVIYHVIKNLVSQDIQVYLIDHHSTDNTVEEASKWLDKGLLQIETFPEESGFNIPQDVYAWRYMLMRKEQIARFLGTGWYIHADADEFRESPWSGLNLRQGIERVDREGYNAINFKIYDFKPTDDSFVPGSDAREYLKYYSPPVLDYDHVQVKCWKNFGQNFELWKSGGHKIAFEGLKVFPVPFILRHYPIRSQAHGMKKVLGERKSRFAPEEKAARWHAQYDQIKDSSYCYIHNKSDLALYDRNAVCNEIKNVYHEAGKKKGMVSIVILTFNELKYTKKCIESIRKHTPEPHEIIFVDNCSTDGTVKWLKQQVKQNDHDSLIQNRQNLGFSKGCNQGIQASAGEYILLLNNDVIVTEGWLSGLLECLNSATDIGIVGPMTNNISGPQRVPMVGYKTIEDLPAYARSFREQNRHRRIQLRRIVGFCMLFRRALVEKIGLLDESFGSGNFEDDDYCLRTVLFGQRNMVAGDVFIHHYGSRSFIGNNIDFSSLISGNRKIFTDKWNQLNLDNKFGEKLLSVNTLEQAKEFHHKGQFDNSTETLLKGIKHAQQERSLYHFLAEILIEDKQFQNALDLLNSIPPDDSDVQKIMLTGFCKEGLKLYDEAEECAKRLLPIPAYLASALNLLGILAYRRGERKDAEAIFLKAIEADPGHGDSYTNLGVLKWEDECHEEALKLIERGFILSPAGLDVATIYHTAVTASMTFAKAEKIFREAKALYPLNKRITFLLTDVLLQQEKQDAAMDEIEQAMTLFGIDDGILAAALKIRQKIGPLMQTRESRHKASISLCMITQNQEPDLAKCLMSVKPIVNEVIVVDTGSSDRTKDIAQAFGAKVYDFPWSGNFSEARNFSLSKASGDWILILDADEVISARDHAGLVQLISQRGQLAAYAFEIKYFLNEAGGGAKDGKHPCEHAGGERFENAQVRLFPNDSRVKFINPIHEIVEPSLKNLGIPIHECSIPIHRLGKKLQEQHTAKAKPTSILPVTINDSRLDHSPINEDSLASMERAVVLYEEEDFDKAADELEKMIAACSDDWPAYHLLVAMMIQSGKVAELPQILQPLKNRKDLPANVYALIGCGFEAAGDLSEAARFSRLAIEHDINCSQAWNLEGILAYRKGDLDGAKERFSKSADLDLDWGDPWTNAGAVHWEQGCIETALECFEKGFLLSPTAPNVAASYHAAVAATGQYDRSRPVFEKIVCRYPNYKKGRFLLIDVLLRLQDDVTAMAQIESVILRFGADSQLLEAATKVRSKLGPMDLNETDTPKLSLCMIVKNEEKHLARCIASLKSLVHEMIVVDTGSTDVTKEIARIFGAKVFDFVWTDDFAAARNFSLDQASGNWVLIVDADEIIASKDHDIIRQALRSADKRCAFSLVTRNYVKLYNTLGWTPNDTNYPEEVAGTGWYPSEKVRLFPNLADIRFEFPVHELVDYALIRNGYAICDLNVPIHHYGKLSAHQPKDKAQRYYHLGQQKFDQLGKNPVAIKELALQAGILGKFDEAVDLWKRLIRLNPDDAGAHVNLCSMLLQLGDVQEARRIAENGYRIAPEIKETQYNLAFVLLRCGQATGSGALLKTLTEKWPEYHAGIFLKGIAQICLNLTEEGLGTIRKLSETPIWPAISYSFSSTLKDLLDSNQINYARQVITAAKELEINNPEIIQYELRLNPLAASFLQPGNAGSIEHHPDGTGQSKPRQFHASTSQKTTVIIVSGRKKVQIDQTLKRMDLDGDLSFPDIILVGANFQTKQHQEKSVKGKRLQCVNIRRKDNPGLVLNRVIEKASGSTIVIVRDDMRFQPKWIEMLVASRKYVSKPGVSGPLTHLLTIDQKLQIKSKSGSGDAMPVIPFRRMQVATLDDFCIVFDRKAYDECGPFDETHGSLSFMIHDFCRRLSLNGYEHFISLDIIFEQQEQVRESGPWISADDQKDRSRLISKWGCMRTDTEENKKAASLVLSEQAAAFIEKDDFIAAKNSLKQAINAHPNNWRAYRLLADLITVSGPDPELLTEIRSLENRTDMPVWMYAVIGSCYEAAGDSDTAARFSVLACEKDPNGAISLNLQGILCYRKGAKDQALKFFRRAAEQDPGWGDPWTNMGAIFWEQEKRKTALECFERGFALSPAAPNVAAAFHGAVTENDAYESFRILFDEVARLYPNFRKGRFFLTDILIKLGDFAAALNEIESVILRFGPDEPLLQTALQLREKVGPMEIHKSDAPTISLCMIVKNEAAHIARCLASLKPIVDEIIVVDTGSTDFTRDIAKVYGAKVFDYEWIDNFAAARNFSIEQSSGKWILVMDADEVISRKDHKRLRDLINRTTLPYPAYCIVTRNYTGLCNTIGWIPNDGTYCEEEAGTGWTPSEKVRLFRNAPEILFDYPVHEVLGPALKRSGVTIKSCDVPIHHYGRLHMENVRQKGENYFRIGMEKLEQMENDALALTELAVEAGLQGHTREAMDLWERLLKLEPRNSKAHINLSTLHGRLGDYANAARYAKSAKALAPDLKEADFNLAMAELYLGNTEKAVSILEKRLKANETYYPARFMAAVGACCSGDLKRADNHLRSLQDTPYWQTLNTFMRELIEGLLHAGQAGLVNHLLGWARNKAFWTEDLDRYQHQLEIAFCDSTAVPC